MFLFTNLSLLSRLTISLDIQADAPTDKQIDKQTYRQTHHKKRGNEKEEEENELLRSNDDSRPIQNSERKLFRFPGKNELHEARRYLIKNNLQFGFCVSHILRL